MIDVAALTSGRRVPSSRFRVRQYVAALRALDISVSEFPGSIEKYAPPPPGFPGKLWTAAKLAGRVPGVLSARRFDVVWLERELVGGRATLERFLPPRTVLDVDDALWRTGAPGFSERIAARCAGVIAGNEFLAEHYRRVCPRVWIVPTSVDTDRWTPNEEGGARAVAEPWTVGWTGTSDNLPYLCAIEDSLAGFLDTHPGTRLLVVSDRSPTFSRIPPNAWRFEPWSPETEVAQLRRMDVGLMPLPDDDWARGKCSAKMLLSMAVGRPVVVSPVGSNAEILAAGPVGLAAREPSDWVGALDRLHRDRTFAAACGAAGRRLVEERYSVAANAPKLAAIFREVALKSNGAA
jgi:glycosyltransferase involved in cell wall biosynthesis